MELLQIEAVRARMRERRADRTAEMQAAEQARLAELGWHRNAHGQRCRPVGLDGRPIYRRQQSIPAQAPGTRRRSPMLRSLSVGPGVACGLGTYLLDVVVAKIFL